MSNKTSACKKCEQRQKTLTEEGLCYNCHIKKYGTAPMKGQYKQEKAEKKQ